MDRDSRDDDTPSPNEFEDYFPYACDKLQAATVHLFRSYQGEYVSASVTERSKAKKLKATPSHMDAEHTKHLGPAPSKSRLQAMSSTIIDNSVRIESIYDAFDNLVHLKFDQNIQIPRLVFKVLGLIVKFYQCLTIITINRGLNKYIVHELNTLLHVSHISDICLDNTFLEEANYDILLKEPTNLRYLSLARCRIPDSVIRNLAEKIVYPLPASNSLSILNLSSNRITDVGAKFLAEALRSNRQLSYLNLADNMIGDDGGVAILDTLVDFELTYDELHSVRRDYVTYLREKSVLVQQILKDLRTTDIDKKVQSRRKQSKAPPLTPKKRGVDRENSLRSVQETYLKSQANLDAIWYEKASTMAETAIGSFNHPFGVMNTVLKDKKVFCTGNYTLCYLNVAYNNLSYVTLKRLMEVMMKQKISNRKPKGLINIPIDGNFLPRTCDELKKIDELIELSLQQERKVSATKTKKQSKSASEKMINTRIKDQHCCSVVASFLSTIPKDTDLGH